MLSKLPFLLTWRYHWDLPELIDLVFEHYVTLSWARWLEALETSEPAAHERISSRFADLPERARLRFLTAPETYRRLFVPAGPRQADALAFVESALIAEAARAGLPVEPSAGEYWTALGDLRITFPAGGDPAPVAGDAAPTLAAGIVVDTASPYSGLDKSVEGGDVRLDDDELDAILPPIADTVERLRAASGAAYETLCGGVRSIVVRSDPARPEHSASSSWSRAIGKVGLVNPARMISEAGSADLANALVHEAIHSLLYKVELVDPLYVSDRAAQEQTVESPWTERTLRLHSFTHACFVWYGLWFFWDLAERSGEFPAEGARRLGALAARGFFHREWEQRVRSVERHLTEPAASAVHRLREILTDTAGPSP